MLKIFVAGASGTIGLPLVRALVEARHQVVALTRSTSGRDALLATGATVAVADALDRESLTAAVMSARPTHVIHQLTALPKHGPKGAGDLAATNRLRIDGTRNLLDAAIAAGARRVIAGSFAPLSPRDRAIAEPAGDAAAAVRSMEDQVLDASGRGAIEGIVLRYGMFYGPGVPSTDVMIDMVRKRRLPVVRDDRGQLPLIHLDDAVSATVCALEHGRPGHAYDIVDDHAASLTEIVEALARGSGSAAPFKVPGWLPRLVAPFTARMMSIRLPLANVDAKAELGWLPKYPTMHEGLAAMFRQAA
jgi:nucleoside-diphosphate-sugar epimerase